MGHLVLTTASFIRRIRAVFDPITQLFFGNAGFGDTAMEMVFRTIRTVKLIGKIGTIYYPVTNQRRLAIISKLSHTAGLGNASSWSIRFGEKFLAIQHVLDIHRQNRQATIFEFLAKVSTR